MCIGGGGVGCGGRGQPPGHAAAALVATSIRAYACVCSGFICTSPYQHQEGFLDSSLMIHDGGAQDVSLHQLVAAYTFVV